jgi:HSP20 family protein
MKKPSFFSRLTGAGDGNQYDDYFDDTQPEHIEFRGSATERHARITPQPANNSGEMELGGELAVDVYQTPDAIVIKAFIAGVQPNTVDISLTREMLTISGVREDEKEVEEDNYFQRELYWGSFSRTILLPEEIDVDMAEAAEKHGILVVRLPKVNKKRQTKLKVRSNR